MILLVVGHLARLELLDLAICARSVAASPTHQGFNLVPEFIRISRIDLDAHHHLHVQHLTLSTTLKSSSTGNATLLHPVVDQLQPRWLYMLLVLGQRHGKLEHVESVTCWGGEGELLSSSSSLRTSAPRRPVAFRLFFPTGTSSSSSEAFESET